MSSKIQHSGIIESVDRDKVRVRIVQTSACSHCSVSSHCGASESKEKVVDVFGTGRGYRVGDEVIITASTKVGLNAVLLGFGIPFLLLLAALITFTRLTANEPQAALGSIACLIPYYAVLYLLRGKLREKLSFTIDA